MKQLLVEVWSDIVCPFCAIGKKNFDLALAQFDHASDFKIEFKSFMLDPNFEHNLDERYNLTQGLAEKYGKSLAEIEQMQQHITTMAKSVGLSFDFEHSYRFNTHNAHKILHKAKEKGLDLKLMESLFSAYLEQGKNLAKPEVLTQLAMENGLSSEAVNDALSNDYYAHQVHQDLQEAKELNISSVPFFVFNRKYAVSGAQPIDVFLQTIKNTYEDWKNTTNTRFDSDIQGNSCGIDGNCN